MQQKSSAAALNWNRFSRFIDGDQRKNAVRDAALFASHMTRHPNLDWDSH
jgi:hypothetical protein